MRISIYTSGSLILPAEYCLGLVITSGPHAGWFPGSTGLRKVWMSHTPVYDWCEAVYSEFYTRLKDKLHFADGGIVQPSATIHGRSMFPAADAADALTS